MPGLSSPVILSNPNSVRQPTLQAHGLGSTAAVQCGTQGEI